MIAGLLVSCQVFGEMPRDSKMRWLGHCPVRNWKLNSYFLLYLNALHINEIKKRVNLNLIHCASPKFPSGCSIPENSREFPPSCTLWSKWTFMHAIECMNPDQIIQTTAIKDQSLQLFRMEFDIQTSRFIQLTNCERHQ